MKSSFIKAAAVVSALTAVALPASAGILLPNLYAREFCEMRAAGVDYDGASSWAVRQSMISGDPIRVRIGDEMYDADVIAANRAVRDRCPQFAN